MLAFSRTLKSPRCCDHARVTIRRAMQYPHPSPLPEGEGGPPELFRSNCGRLMPLGLGARVVTARTPLLPTRLIERADERRRECYSPSVSYQPDILVVSPDDYTVHLVVEAKLVSGKDEAAEMALKHTMMRMRAPTGILVTRDKISERV